MCLLGRHFISSFVNRRSRGCISGWGQSISLWSILNGCIEIESIHYFIDHSWMDALWGVWIRYCGEDKIGS